MKHNIINPVFLSSTLVLFSFAAFADIGGIGGNIGGIGSPVVPSNGPSTNPQVAIPPGMDNVGTPDKEKDSKQETVFTHDIPFNQNRVNFQTELHHAITANEKNSPGTMYEVVSTIPNTNNMNSGQMSRLNITFNANLDAVVQEMLASGVQMNRIQTRTVINDDVSSQDVSINGTATTSK